jgi:hypothetical protein
MSALDHLAGHSDRLTRATLRESVRQVIAQSEYQHPKPAWIASKLLQILDPNNVCPRLVQLACALEMRRIASEELRKIERKQEQSGQLDHGTEDLDARQQDLFCAEVTFHG